MRIDTTGAAPVGNRRAGFHPAPHLELLAVGIFGRTPLGNRIEMLLRRGREFSPRVSLARVAASAVVLLMFIVAGSLAPRWIAFAQPEPHPSFEVATIKPGDPNDQRTFVGTQKGGHFFTINASLKMLIGFAYNVRPHQLMGGPKWLDADKYTIDAKPDSAIPRGPQAEGQYRLMAQSLLEERFKLVVHRETKEGPIYELVVAKGGPKLKEFVETGAPGPRGVGMRGPHLTGADASMDVFANVLAAMLGRSVVDKTGLKGKYEFTLDWTPDPGQGGFGPAGPPPPSDGPSGPSIYTALQEQLGLKLESAKGPVEMIVIDHAEKPDAN